MDGAGLEDGSGEL